MAGAVIGEVLRLRAKREPDRTVYALVAYLREGSCDPPRFQGVRPAFVEPSLVSNNAAVAEVISRTPRKVWGSISP